MSAIDHPSPPLATPSEGALPEVRRAGLFASLLELTKPGITRLVTITAAVGFAMAWMVSSGPPGSTASGATPWGLAWLGLATIVGAALSSAGAGALNEWWERDRDALMRRTRNRPIPDGRLTPRQGLLTGLALSVAGVLVLLAAVNWAAAAISLVTILSYIVVYTPLKPLTPLSTLVGAVPGALPPLIGWAGGWQASAGAGPLAAHGLAHAGGWSIVLLMVVWQIPHFLAIAWMHRDDYAAGGHRVLSVVDEEGSTAARTALLWAGMLVPVSLLPVAVMRERLGWLAVAAALGLGAWLVVAAARLLRSRKVRDARRLFLVSIIHLPLALAALVIDAALL